MRCNLQHLTDYDLDKLRVTEGEAAESSIELPLAEVLRHLCFSMTRVLLDLHTLQPQHFVDQDFDKLRCPESGKGTHPYVTSWEAFVELPLLSPRGSVVFVRI